MSYDVMMAHNDLTSLDTSDIALNGLCPHVFVDSFVPPEMDGLYDSEQGRQLAAMGTASGAAKILWNRYRNNHTYESGSVVVHLRPDIRVGNGLLIQQLDGSYKEYFIEQVSHQCVFNPRRSSSPRCSLPEVRNQSPGTLRTPANLQGAIMSDIAIGIRVDRSELHAAIKELQEYKSVLGSIGGTLPGMEQKTLPGVAAGIQQMQQMQGVGGRTVSSDLPKQIGRPGFDHEANRHKPAKLADSGI